MSGQHGGNQRGETQRRWPRLQHEGLEMSGNFQCFILKVLGRREKATGALDVRD